MNNSAKKTSIISIMLILTVGIISGCASNGNSNNEKIEENTTANTLNVDINDKNAKALEISKPEVINETKDSHNLIDTKTKVKNISNFDIRNIQLTFREYDRDNNALAKTDALSKITLKPGESVYIQSAHKKYAKSADVIAYTYGTGDKWVNVDTLNHKVNITDIKEKIVKNKKYDILTISEPKLVNQVDGGYNSQITIKNLSDKDIGSVVIELAELNGNNEYTNVSYVDSYEVIKKYQEIKLNSVHPNDAKKLEVIGYIYDDIKDNTTVEVNLKLDEVILMK